MIHLICPNPAIDRTLLVKNFSSSKPNRPYEVREFPGGKSFNVAYAIKQEEPNADLTVHTILGGYNGEYLRELANKNNISLTETKVDQNTRLCNIIVDTENNTIYPIYEKGLQLSNPILETFTENIIHAVNEEDIVVFSGSLMKGMPDDFIAQVIKRLAGKKVKVFVDTSGNALVEAYKAKPLLIKINDEEILELFPNRELNTIDDYYQLLQEVTIDYFIITLGAKGVIAKMQNDYYYLKAKEIDAKNPVASGDFFLGILTSYVKRGLNSEEALKMAITYSTANCLNWYPAVNKEDIKNIYDTITIEKLS